MIQTKILLRVISHLFLPSLAILILLFFWFFSITDFVNFLTSNALGAKTIRILMIVAEFVFGFTLYKEFVKEGSLKSSHVQDSDKLEFLGKRTSERLSSVTLKSVFAYYGIIDDTRKNISFYKHPIDKNISIIKIENENE